MKKWIAKIEMVDWPFDSDITESDAKELNERYVNRVLNLLCHEDEIEEVLRETIDCETSYRPEEVEYSYRRA